MELFGDVFPVGGFDYCTYFPTYLPIYQIRDCFASLYLFTLCLSSSFLFSSSTFMGVLDF